MSPKVTLEHGERIAVVSWMTSVISNYSTNPNGTPRQIVAGISNKEKRELGAPLLRAFLKLAS